MAQTGLMSRLIRIFAWCNHFVSLVVMAQIGFEEAINKNRDKVNVLKFRNTSFLQKMAKTNSADPYQTASEEAD